MHLETHLSFFSGAKDTFIEKLYISKENICDSFLLAANKSRACSCYYDDINLNAAMRRFFTNSSMLML